MSVTEGQGRAHKQAKLLDALRGGSTRTAAARYAGVDRDTFYDWLADSTFSDAVAQAETAPQVGCAAAIVRASQKDWRAGAWWLERRYPASWREIKQLDVRTLTVEQLAGLIEVLGGGARHPALGAGAETGALLDALPSDSSLSD